MTIKRFFLLVTLSVFLSCSSPKYEYIIKDDLFRTTIKKGNFLELKNKYKDFDVIETGWPKIDIYGKELQKYNNDKVQEIYPR